MARAKKASASAEGEKLTNGPDPETISSYARKVMDADDEIEQASIVYKSAVGRRRAILKAAKSQGVVNDDLLWVMQAKKMGKAAVEAQLQNRARYAAILSFPIGTQFGMFDDIPQQVIDDNARRQATRDGISAGKAGHDRVSTNPHDPASELFQCFDRGWIQGQESILAGNDHKVAQAQAGRKGVGPEAGPQSDDADVVAEEIAAKAEATIPADAKPATKQEMIAAIWKTARFHKLGGQGTVKGAQTFTAQIITANTADGLHVASFGWVMGTNAGGGIFTDSQLGFPCEDEPHARRDGLVALKADLQGFLDSAGDDVSAVETECAKTWIGELAAMDKHDFADLRKVAADAETEQAAAE